MQKTKSLSALGPAGYLNYVKYYELGAPLTIFCKSQNDKLLSRLSPRMARVTTSLMDPPGIRHQCLMLADSESEKTKWVVALNELHRILKKNKLPDR